MEILRQGQETEYALEFIDIMEECDRVEAYSTIKSRIADVYESDIWEAVDSEDNGIGLDFDDIISDIMDGIEDRVDDLIHERG
jgi:hypothetical protein